MTVTPNRRSAPAAGRAGSGTKGHTGVSGRAHGPGRAGLVDLEGTAGATGATGATDRTTGSAGAPCAAGATALGGGRTGTTTLLVIAKEPVPGRVKTRLTPVYTPEEAARLAAAALADTLDTVLACPARRRVLALAGCTGPWLPSGIEVVPQCAGGLDERLAAAFAACAGPTLLIGMDTPQVTPELLAPVLADDAWRDCDAWFGPAADGGFWALGLAAPDPALLRGVPMSTPDTGTVQRGRLVDAGLRVRDLPVLRDVDTPDDAASVAAAAPAGRFARALARLPRPAAL